MSTLNTVRLKEQSEEKSDDGKLWEAVNNFIFQFLGFVFLYISLERLVKLDDIEDTGNLAVHTILFLVLFFYSAFCMSGRGIEVIQPIIDTLRKGEVEIKIPWATGTLRSKGKERDKEEGKDIGK